MSRAVSMWLEDCAPFCRSSLPGAKIKQWEEPLLTGQLKMTTSCSSGSCRAVGDMLLKGPSKHMKHGAHLVLEAAALHHAPYEFDLAIVR